MVMSTSKAEKASGDGCVTWTVSQGKFLFGLQTMRRTDQREHLMLTFTLGTVAIALGLKTKT